jgi:hypothetical protein
MYSLDRYARRIARNLNAVYVDITTISDANFQLSKTKASLENTLSVIDTKFQLNDSNIDSTYARLCDINLSFSTLYTELTSIIQELRVAMQDVDYLNRTAETSSLGLARLSENISILKAFYLDADEKVRAIESYLSSFIIGGDNVHLDFGTDYTVVHAIPPAMPPRPTGKKSIT